MPCGPGSSHGRSRCHRARRAVGGRKGQRQELDRGHGLRRGHLELVEAGIGAHAVTLRFLQGRGIPLARATASLAHGDLSGISNATPTPADAGGQ